MKIFFLLLLLFQSIILSQQLKVVIPSKDTLNREQQYTFNLNVENFNNVGTFQFKIGFRNTNLELVELPTGNFSGRNITTNTLANANTTGELVIVWLSDGVNPLNYGTALLTNLKYKVKLNAASGLDSLKFNQCLVSNVAGNSLNPLFMGSGFIIRQPAVNVVANSINNLSFNLSQNYPNPFNPSTVIAFNLAKSSHVVLSVYNILGNLKAVPVNEFKVAGSYEIKFYAQHLASGVYFYKLTAGGVSIVKKMIIGK